MVESNENKGIKMVAEIDTDKVFKDIKKHHGEEFAKIMRGDRDHDGSLLVVPNIVHILEFAGHVNML